MHGAINVTSYWGGSMYLTGDLCNNITIGGDFGIENSWYDRSWIFIDGDIVDPSDPTDPSTFNRITVAGHSYRGIIHVKGDVGGQIVITGWMRGARIHINGTLKNYLLGDDCEIETAGMTSFYDDETNPPNEDGMYYSAIAVNYDGYDGGDWENGVEVKVGANEYDGTNETLHIWKVSPCKGNLDGDTDVDLDDWALYDDSDEDYENAYPGLEGSRIYHSDGNCDGEWYSSDDPDDRYDDDNDYPYIHSFTNVGDADPACCVTWAVTLPLCPADVWYDGDVGLDDLSELLGRYGACIGDPLYSESVDFVADGCIDLKDLAFLLGYYGPCICPSGGAGLRESLERSLTPAECVTLSVAAIDTGGYTGGGFVGEVDHFVFDLKIEVQDPNNDDWIVTGAALDASNDAEFRLSAASSYPDQYATFVAAPWTTLPGSPTAGVAGGYDPVDPDETFATDEINIGWYDTSASSHDGPATVMRIVIDVSDVTGTDVSGGFGAVYFGKAKRDVDDILVAELSAGAGTKLSEGGLATFGGSFFVIGQ